MRKGPVTAMIKGCQRKIIVIKDTGSRYFDTAYFVLKRDLPESGSDTDMLAEANRMLDSCSVVRHHRLAVASAGVECRTGNDKI